LTDRRAGPNFQSDKKTADGGEGLSHYPPFSIKPRLWIWGGQFSLLLPGHLFLFPYQVPCRSIIAAMDDPFFPSHQDSEVRNARQPGTAVGDAAALVLGQVGPTLPPIGIIFPTIGVLDGIVGRRIRV
jgi:hypothetical protein